MFKECTGCKKTKHRDLFSKAKLRADGLQGECKACSKERKLLDRYGITHQDYLRMLEEQNECCAICEIHIDEYSQYRHFHVDHCHTTGEVRGLLCFPCNTAIGLLGDDPVNTDRATKYLNK